MKRTLRSLKKWLCNRDRTPISDRLIVDLHTGEIILEARCLVELLFSGIYIGWPFFKYSMGNGKAYRALTEVLAVEQWGVIFYVSAALVFISYLSGHRRIRRLVSAWTLFLWGAVMFIMYTELVPGWVIPLGTTALLFEGLRGYRLKERRDHVRYK